MTQTLVSGFFDLGRRDGTGRRPPDFFFRYGTYVLAQPMPLVLFVDPAFESWALHERKRRGLGGITWIVARPLEDFDAAALVPRLTGLVSPENIDSGEKETPWHLVLQYSKVDMLCRAITEDPFHTGHFAWIDFGLSHVARPPVSFPAPSDKVAMLQMVAVSGQEIEDPIDFYRYERGRIAGGFFRGHADCLVEFGRAFEVELAAALAAGCRPNDQMVFSLMAARHPDLFAFYFGDYTSILCNWDFIRDGFDTVMLNLAFCREHGLWVAGLAVHDALERSLESGALALDADQKARWLDEYYVAAWYGGRRGLCAALACDLDRLRESAYYRDNQNRLDANLALLKNV